MSMKGHQNVEGQHQDHDQKHEQDHGQGQGGHHMRNMYLRYAAMILTGMVVMYAVMFVGTYRWDHIRFSESRVFMALTMGGAMALVMIGWMLNMYKNTKANIAVVTAGVLLLAGGVFLDRSQTTVQDTAYMNSMIPHHSLAITRSERAELADIRVCELAVEISEAQRREIDEMEWLIQDIDANGLVTTPEEAQARPIPTFEASADRQCATG